MRPSLEILSIAKVFSASRDITGWYVCHVTKTVIFNQGENDLDAKITHVSHKADHNEHGGRLFIQRERASRNMRVTTMPARNVGIGAAGSHVDHPTLDIPDRQALIAVDPPLPYPYFHVILLDRIDGSNWVIADPEGTVEAVDVSEEQIIPLPRNARFPEGGRPASFSDTCPS